MAYKKGSPSDLKRKAAQKQTQKNRDKHPKELGPGVTVNPQGGLQDSRGGPGFIIDKKKLMKMAETMCSYDDIALVFGVAPQFLRDHYKDVIEAGRANARNGLRSSQFALAKGGNVVMQIWLGKNYLGQSDKLVTEHTGKDGKPIQADVTKRVVAYIPDNQRDATPAVSGPSASPSAPPGTPETPAT